MSIEIKFRGRVIEREKGSKVKVGEFATGDLDQNWKGIGKTYIYALEGRKIRAYRVDPETVGQFTGLFDKNGKEIFKGDVIKLEGWEPQIYQVGFIRGGFCFYRPGDAHAHDCKYLEKSEFIGNIYENPELVK